MIELMQKLGVEPEIIIAAIKASRSELPKQMKVSVEVYCQMLYEAETAAPLDPQGRLYYYNCLMEIDETLSPAWEE